MSREKNGLSRKFAKLRGLKPSQILDLMRVNLDHYLLHDLRLHLRYNLPANRVPFPRSISIKLTNRCNLHCVMCGQTKSRHQAWQRQELTPDEWALFISNMGTQRPNITLWGGEPLLYKGIGRVLDAASAQQLRVGIITNGVLLEDMAPELAKYDNLELAVSVDGPPSIHDRIRGKKGVFSMLERGVSALRRACRRLGKDTVPVAVYSVVTPLNQHKLSETIETAALLRPRAMYIGYITFVTDEMINATNRITERELGVRFSSLEGFKTDVSKYDIAHLAEVTRDLQEAQRYPFRVRFNPKLAAPDVERYYRDTRYAMGRKTCYSPWVLAAILPNGQVSFCADFPDYRFGDVRCQDFADIWNGEDAVRFRRLLKQRGLFPMCYRCCGLWNNQPRSKS